MPVAPDLEIVDAWLRLGGKVEAWPVLRDDWHGVWNVRIAGGPTGPPVQVNRDTVRVWFVRHGNFIILEDVSMSNLANKRED